MVAKLVGAGFESGSLIVTIPLLSGSLLPPPYLIFPDSTDLPHCLSHGFYLDIKVHPGWNRPLRSLNVGLPLFPFEGQHLLPHSSTACYQSAPLLGILGWSCSHVIFQDLSHTPSPCPAGTSTDQTPVGLVPPSRWKTHKRDCPQDSEWLLSLSRGSLMHRYRPVAYVL